MEENELRGIVESEREEKSHITQNLKKKKKKIYIYIYR